MKTAFHNRKEIKPQIQEANKKKKWNILRGDTVQIVEKSHSEYGKQGIVSLVDRARDRVIVEGVNVAPKHIKVNITCRLLTSKGSYTQVGTVTSPNTEH